VGVYDSPSSIVNTTISGNRNPSGGGGIHVIGAGGLVVASTTITENVADSDRSGDGDGGGISVSADLGSPTVQLRNTIVWGNLDAGAEAPECSGSLVSGGYNLLGDMRGCTLAGDLTGNVSRVDPKLAPLQDNGGPTDTHALLFGSPAVDAGDPAGCTDADGSPLITDQRGAPRAQGPSCDIGAFESGCGNGSLDLGEECDDGNYSDGDCCSFHCALEPAGSPCDDSDACTTGDACVDGTCVGGLPPACDPCEVCDSSVGCTLPPTSGCTAATSGGSVVMVKNTDNDPRDALTWRWKAPGPLSPADIGQPLAGTDYTLCLIDFRASAPTLVASSSTSSDGLCDGAPCWTSGRRGYRYKDRAPNADGLLRMFLRPTLTERGRIVVKGTGGGLFPLVPPVTVRVLRNDGSHCWEADFTAPVKSTGTIFKARSE
jgi:cysteine-rich repeat protein